MPRHSTLACSPGGSLLTSTFTGALAARLRALGLMLRIKGTVAIAKPALPTTVVAAVRSLRFVRSTLSAFTASYLSPAHLPQPCGPGISAHRAGIHSLACTAALSRSVRWCTLTVVSLIPSIIHKLHCTFVDTHVKGRQIFISRKFQDSPLVCQNGHRTTARASKLRLRLLSEYRQTQRKPVHRPVQVVIVYNYSQKS